MVKAPASFPDLGVIGLVDMRTAAHIYELDDALGEWLRPVCSARAGSNPAGVVFFFFFVFLFVFLFLWCCFLVKHSLAGDVELRKKMLKYFPSFVFRGNEESRSTWQLKK